MATYTERLERHYQNHLRAIADLRALRRTAPPEDVEHLTRLIDRMEEINTAYHQALHL